MDLRGTPDGEYKWILQMKDHFSRFIWVYALKDKSSASVGKILKEWFCQNGYPKYWYVRASTRINSAWNQTNLQGFHLRYYASDLYQNSYRNAGLKLVPRSTLVATHVK